jgi:2-dehydro-3-deoxyphosphogluconate aldolase / (4S)-4-hydroxy-2-oxoglutarate aldolase
MAHFSRLEIAKAMTETGMVPLFYNPDIEICKNIVKASYDGGARLMEFTARGDFAHEVFGELNKFVIKKLPDMILGVGSITDSGMASHYMALGANFIVTPVFRKDIAKVCNRQKILWIPGCGSLTEIAKAEEWGCEIVKLFPGDIYGPTFVKCIKGPQPWTNIMPTGGVVPTIENLSGWFDAGVSCVGIGSQLISKEIIVNKDYDKLTTAVKNVLEMIKSIREKL